MDKPLGDITLEQLCRALAAHVLMSAHPHLLHDFMAPETAQLRGECLRTSIDPLLYLSIHKYFPFLTMCL